MQQLISWSKTWLCYISGKYFWSSLESPGHSLLLEPASNNRKVLKSNIV